MSVALESGTGIGGSGFIRGIGCGPIYGSLDIQNDVVRPQLLSADSSSSSSSSSSSIGKDSCTESEDSEDGAMGEVQSAYKGALQGMGALEESLPIRKRPLIVSGELNLSNLWDKAVDDGGYDDEDAGLDPSNMIFIGNF